LVALLAALAATPRAADPAEDGFGVHLMLRAAVTAGALGPGTVANDEVGRITEQCVPQNLQVAWRKNVDDAIGHMLQKTRRLMQRGLRELSEGVTRLLAGATCGDLASLERMKEQANRLGVFASTRSLGNFDGAFKYAPLKVLVVGGSDIHTEVNEFIAAWKLNKGEEDVGQALAALLNDFSEDAKETPAPGTPASTGTSEAGARDVADGDLDERRTSRFWADVLRVVLKGLGGGQDLVSEMCPKAEPAERYADGLEAAFNRMLEKTRAGMRAGLLDVAKATLDFLESLEACGMAESTWRAATGFNTLRSAASRLTVMASAKTLMNFGRDVVYEPMQTLKVGGIDVHAELNRLIIAWIQKKGAAELGGGLVDFFGDFGEYEEQEDKPPEDANQAAGESEMLSFLRDALAAAADGVDRAKLLAGDCLTEALAVAFADGVERALEHMLQKRKRTMQLGLKELADTSVQLLGKLSYPCAADAGSRVVLQAAKKLSRLTRRTVVDYGTHIKYEAMKSLEVGKVPIHTELNSFIVAWKLRSRREAGTPFGQLMRKCSTIEGHDEL